MLPTEYELPAPTINLSLKSGTVDPTTDCNSVVLQGQRTMGQHSIQMNIDPHDIDAAIRRSNWQEIHAW